MMTDEQRIEETTEQEHVPAEAVCSSCGAHFESSLPKCPYCGNLSYPGAEEEYLSKLEDVREDVDDLKEIPVEETKKVIKGQLGRIGKILLVLSILLVVGVLCLCWRDYRRKRDQKADYLWKAENYPVMEEMYREGRFEELIQFYMKASMLDRPVYGWEHSDFCEVYRDILYLQKCFDNEAADRVLSQTEYAEILYYEWDFAAGSYFIDGLDVEETGLLQEDMDAIRQDFRDRWQFTEEERAYFQELADKNHGWLGYDDCVRYVKDWYREHHEELAK